MHAIDTSLLYALFDAADKWHKDAKQLVQEHRPILVPPGTLQETVDLLAYRHGRTKARQALAWMDAQNGFVITDEQVSRGQRAAVALFMDAEQDRNKGALSFADAWCIGHAVEAGVGLLTKDAHQAAVFRNVAAKQSRRGNDDL